jgi:hypothetical protein
LERNTVQKILKAENRKIGKYKEGMTEKRDQREFLWFQTGGALNFITAAPHCGTCPSGQRGALASRKSQVPISAVAVN